MQQDIIYNKGNKIVCIDAKYDWLTVGEVYIVTQDSCTDSVIVYTGDAEYWASTNLFIPFVEEVTDTTPPKINIECNVKELQGLNLPVKSTGGSSSYYQIKIKRASDGEVFECELGDVLYSAFGGDFDLCNIVKACRRMYLASKGGGKEGTDIEYDANKIKWFADDFVCIVLNNQGLS